MNKEILISTSADETIEIASKFIANLKNKRVNIFLNGDLGAGKTHFVKGIFKGIGLHQNPTSPTYDLVLSYEFGELQINHLDLYRIETLNLEDEIWLNQILEQESLNIIEWGNKFNFENLIKPQFQISILVIGENERKIEIYSN